MHVYVYAHVCTTVRGLRSRGQLVKLYSGTVLTQIAVSLGANNVAFFSPDGDVLCDATWMTTTGASPHSCTPPPPPSISNQHQHHQITENHPQSSYKPLKIHHVPSQIYTYKVWTPKTGDQLLFLNICHIWSLLIFGLYGAGMDVDLFRRQWLVTYYGVCP